MKLETAKKWAKKVWGWLAIILFAVLAIFLGGKFKGRGGNKRVEEVEKKNKELEAEKKKLIGEANAHQQNVIKTATDAKNASKNGQAKIDKIKNSNNSLDDEIDAWNNED